MSLRSGGTRVHGKISFEGVYYTNGYVGGIVADWVGVERVAGRDKKIGGAEAGKKAKKER